MELEMKTIITSIFGFITLSLSFILISGMLAAPASAAPAHDEFAASIDDGKLPPCPSMFKCRVE
jgi:hypothetical protein